MPLQPWHYGSSKTFEVWQKFSKKKPAQGGLFEHSAT